MKSNTDITVKALIKSKTILYPADTIWGLGCDATNQKAVDAIFKLKNRSKNKPLIALVSSIDMLRQYVEAVPENIEELLQNEQPTTLVYPKGKGLAKGVISDNESVAIRIPKPCFALDLITGKTNC
jgi:L-threonylcarbamoyladenylate synthase